MYKITAYEVFFLNLVISERIKKYLRKSPVVSLLRALAFVSDRKKCPSDNNNALILRTLKTSALKCINTVNCNAFVRKNLHGLVEIII